MHWSARPTGSFLGAVLIDVPNLPVCKHKKVGVRDLQVNNGLHINAVVLMSPRREGRNHGFPAVSSDDILILN
jgi:hypothetical protein